MNKDFKDFKDFKDMKTEYEEIKASDALKERVGQIMTQQEKKAGRSKVIKRVSVIAASFLLLITAALNISPSFAYALSDVPILNNVVKVLTLSKYETKQNGYEANIVTPQIEGLLNKDLQGKLNAQFKNDANALIASVEQDLKAKAGEGEIHKGVDSSFEIRTDNAKYLAFDIYVLETQASSYTTHSFYTINKKSGEIVTLSSLFKKDGDYVAVLSDYLKKEMIRQNQAEGGAFFVGPDDIEPFEKIKADQNFYINDKDELVICFDQFEAAAGSQGSPEFVIPNEVIKHIAK